MGTLPDALLRRHAVVAGHMGGTHNCAGRCSLNLGPLKAACEGFWDHLPARVLLNPPG